MSKYDKASLVHIPSGYKSGTLYNVLPNDADGDFDFFRGSTATRVNKDGLIETVATGTPRLDYPLLDGVVQDCPALLLEPVRGNYVPRSEDFDTGWAKARISVTNNNIISPDGSQNAAKITEDTDTGSHVVYDTLTGSVSPSVTCYFSCFVKKGTKRYIQLREGFSNTQANIDTNTFTLANSVNLTDYEIQEYGNGWHRISFKFTSNGSGDIQFSCYLLDDSQNTSYTGDGTSYVYLWGAQIEDNAGYVSSYIPTSGSAVTRSADVCNGAQADFNDSEGVLFAEIAAISDDATYELISISDGTVNNFVSLGYNNSQDESYKQVKFGVNNVFGDFTDPINRTLYNKMALKYKSGDSSFYINGFKIDSSSTTFTPSASMNELKFSYFTGGDNFYGNTKQLMTFNEALSDTELENLTSWDSFREMATEQLYSIE